MSEKDLAANPEVQTFESEEGARLTSEDTSQNLLADAQNVPVKCDTTPAAKADAEPPVPHSTSMERDLAALILGGPLHFGIYKENQKELDPVIDACERFSMEANMFPLRVGQRMAENTVNKPLTTALELITFGAIPALHASLSVINDRLKS